MRETVIGKLPPGRLPANKFFPVLDRIRVYVNVGGNLPCATQLEAGLLLKKLKYFEVMLLTLCC